MTCADQFRMMAFAQLTYHECLRDISGIEVENTTYALNSTTIDLCLSLFPWALFRTTILSLSGCIGVLP